MSEVTDKSLNQLHEAGDDVGNFYPRGHVVLAFESPEQARNTEQAVREAGFTDVAAFTDRQVIEATQKGLDSAGITAALGASLKMVEIQNKLATEGCHFLLVKAPKEEDSERLMEVVRRRPFRLAQKYHRLVIETLH